MSDIVDRRMQQDTDSMFADVFEVLEATNPRNREEFLINYKLFRGRPFIGFFDLLPADAAGNVEARNLEEEEDTSNEESSSSSDDCSDCTDEYTDEYSSTEEASDTDDFSAEEEEAMDHLQMEDNPIVEEVEEEVVCFEDSAYFIVPSFESVSLDCLMISDMEPTVALSDMAIIYKTDS